jgi:hypothetical protein
MQNADWITENIEDCFLVELNKLKIYEKDYLDENLKILKTIFIDQHFIKEQLKLLSIYENLVDIKNLLRKKN